VTLDLRREAAQTLPMTMDASFGSAPIRLVPPGEQVAFDRKELNQIMGLYGRMVAAGEWRDYALAFLKEVAIFAAFRRATEYPLYRIEKRPRLRQRQGQYALMGSEGQVLKRGNDLGSLLAVLERKLIRPV
jgi:Protein of unknown function (DUF2794)